MGWCAAGHGRVDGGEFDGAGPAEVLHAADDLGRVAGRRGEEAVDEGGGDGDERQPVGPLAPVAVLDGLLGVVGVEGDLDAGGVGGAGSVHRAPPVTAV
ncbi:hypothetical protein GCM10014715_78850 [Streptomyces spiralis]|uniref:Uncharacterized protein n=1 Tax=Streptomyces spiralis TaxID=66376 RepID=A0A919E490_9ACTN|nr:hypothetical protein GCM10014715_78850 [Streptomyces spiralis]